MAADSHSLGPTCAFYEEESDTDLLEGSEPPKVKAQFFYVSSLPLDDPLSALPPIQQPGKSSKHPPQPFSARDNAALEEAWQALQKGNDPREGKKPVSRPKPTRGMFSFPKFKEAKKSSAPLSSETDSALKTQHAEQEMIENTYIKLRSPPPHTAATSQTAAGIDSKRDATELVRSPTESANTFGKGGSAGSKSVRGRGPKGVTEQQALSESQVLLSQPPPDPQDAEKPVDAEELRSNDPDYNKEEDEQPKRKRHLSPFRRRPKGDKADRAPSSSTSAAPSEATVTHPAQPQANASADISGRPFARAPSKRNIATVDGSLDAPNLSEGSDEDGRPRLSRLLSPTRSRGKSEEANRKAVFVPVGASRLHLVEIPDMVMKPIYWSPINDTSSVIRATWFYKDTMAPVPANIANRLEVGYEYIKPYANSYQEELQACVDNGASAELKIVYKLWSESPSRPPTSTDQKSSEQLTVEQDGAATPRPDAQGNAAIDHREDASKTLFETHSVIYTDRKNAQLLRPSLLPSVQQNRRPLSSIRKGRNIGVAVVRGFDRQAYMKIHPDPKRDARTAHAKVGAYMSQSDDATTRGRRMSCSACDRSAQAPKVSDLVLVIHGIGQKLSERIDSYHFTHAINGLRREFNVELSTEAVKGTLKDNTGIMVLPVNWRLTVDFDEPSKNSKSKDDNKFQLQDVTPNSLQGVRSLISDVMLDIPYYLSHHKQKMISAVIREANRVYRLWCKNNPGFQENGRVHLIAHSLGSVMAMEILSQQPTKLPQELKLDSKKPSETIFEFDTTNLFCCGSPSGFFLLLNGASLIPRKGRDKPGMEGEDHGPGIAGEAAYGCLAVDNIYNIVHRNDPIAYLQNASVDKDLAASLEPASLPSTSVSLFARVGNTLRWASTSTSNAYTVVAPSGRPQVQHMPSTVEMETHNFTREEIAEKRIFLLNDNGQIDYFLNSGGGPLEIQYLNMLSAHSSYWVLQDFVRFLVVEIGRQPGKDHTIPILRAVKKREYKRGTIA